MEILKQGQYSPLSVGKQVAIIYLGTKGLLKDVPVNRVMDFERDFLAKMEKDHKDVLDQLSDGKLSDEITSAIEAAGASVAANFKA